MDTKTTIKMYNALNKWRRKNGPQGYEATLEDFLAEEYKSKLFQKFLMGLDLDKRISGRAELILDMLIPVIKKGMDLYMYGQPTLRRRVDGLVRHHLTNLLGLDRKRWMAHLDNSRLEAVTEIRMLATFFVRENLGGKYGVDR